MNSEPWRWNTASDVPDNEVAVLEAFWVSEYGLIPAAGKGTPGAQELARGRELHELNCLGCHSRPQAAFVSYPLSRVLLPVAAALDRGGVVTVLWTVHFLACFAWDSRTWPSARCFTSSALLSAFWWRRWRRPSESSAAAATRQVIELDGCSHGGACHEACPVRQRRMERIESAQPYAPHVRLRGGEDLNADAG